jgi:hypothetical protein
MSEEFEFDASRDAYVLQRPSGDHRFRLVVPRDFVDDEVGGAATEADRLNWLRGNLAQILAAYTARIDGGWVKAPWNRVLVEEVD